MEVGLAGGAVDGSAPDPAPSDSAGGTARQTIALGDDGDGPGGGVA